jgi:RNA polymerase sigma factor (sigma-70 family)
VNDETDFTRLMAGLRAGDSAAIEEIARRHGRAIRAAVRQHLHPRLRDRLDSIDVVQDVWASFLGIPPERLKFDSPVALAAFLKQVAIHRVVDVYRERFKTQKNDITRETTGDGESARVCTATPSMCVSANEEWERMLSNFPESKRVILLRLRDGHDHHEIAQMANVSVSTVNRLVKRLKEMTGA